MTSTITFLLLIISIFSTRISFGIPYAVYLSIYILLIILLFRNFSQTNKLRNQNEYRPINIYFIYIAASIGCGYFIANGYWMWKQFIINQITLLFILFFYYFSNPKNVFLFMHKWFLYAIIAFVPFSFFMTSDS